jgi:hypothetical protein
MGGANREQERILVIGGKPLTRLDNIMVDLGEIGWGVGDWFDLVLDRNNWRALVNAAMNLRFPYLAGKLSSGCTTSNLPSCAQFHRVSE